MRLKIVNVGEPVLRTVARKLSKEEVLTPETQNLIELMRETVRDAPGVGLAAPQVGVPVRLAVIEDKTEYHKLLSEEELKERGRAPIPFHVIVNPKIESSSESSNRFFEGCLSLPGFSAQVSRSRDVRVTCLDHEGTPRVLDASGWYARILQHEIDHLNGLLYIDRMDTRSFTSLENYTRYWK
jgi:peptide deformylase